ncbi:hypothetical protein [Streptomyces sp. NPDC046985]|uniref:hypothetical protein n=1 Tax=Streptomyces sp. NPDC046985 TaxID=3155377 RepID=UPI0033E3584B
MPRPTAAQLAYGSCTVVLSTLAMLLLSQTSSGVGVAIVALAALALGLLVATTVPLPGTRASAARATAAEPAQAGPPGRTGQRAPETGPAGRATAPEAREPVSAGVRDGRGRSARTT